MSGTQGEPLPEGTPDRRFARAAVAIALLVALALAGLRTPAPFHDADAFDYAHLGRELREGRGFTTRQAFPRHLAWFAERGLSPREDWPNLYRYPLPIVFQALTGAIVEDPRLAGQVRSGAFFALAAGLSFLLLTRFLGTPLALVGVLLVLSDGKLWLDALSGMVESQATCLVLLLAWLLTGPLGGVRRLVVLGLATAALYLTKHQYGPVAALVPLALWARMPWREALRATCPFALAFLVALAPWLARNAALTGDPLFSFSLSRNLVLGTTEVGSDVEMRLDESGDMGPLLEKHGDAIRGKFLRNLGLLFQGFVVVGSAAHSTLSVALFLCMPWWLLRARGAGARAGPLAALGVFTVGLVLLVALSLSLSFHVERFGFPLRPLLLCTALAIVARWIGVDRGTPAPARARAVLLAVLVLVVAHRGWWGILQGQALFGESTESVVDPYPRLNELTRADAVIASDVSYRIAMETERRTVRLPLHPAELLRLSAELVPLRYVHLSPAIDVASRRQTPPRGIFARYPHYGAFTRTEAFRERYALLEILPDGSRLYESRDARAR